MAAVGSTAQRARSNKLTSMTPTPTAPTAPAPFWLPPISRTSTINLSKIKGSADEDNENDAPSLSSNDPDNPDNPPAGAASADQPTTSANGQSQSLSSAPTATPRSAPPKSSPLPSQKQTPTAPHPHPNSNPNPNPNPTPNPNPKPNGQDAQSGMPQHSNAPVAASQAPQRGAIQVPHQMMTGRGGSVGQPVPGQMMVNGRGQTIIALPGGRQWTVQESHLAEPLNPSNRNRSANSLRTYTYDKETEVEGSPPPRHVNTFPQPPSRHPANTPASPPPQQHATALSQPQQPQPRISNNLSSAKSTPRHIPLIPIQPIQPIQEGDQHAPSRPWGQVSLSQVSLLRGRKGSAGYGGDISDDRSLKDAGGRLDSISSLGAAGDDVNDKHKWSSSSLFGLGHRRNSSTATAVEQGPPESSPERKRNFFSSVTGLSQPKSKSNLGLSTYPSAEKPDQAAPAPQPTGDRVQSKGRLSELQVMIKGVGHAKEGVKDDQPTKIETIYEDRPSMESSRGRGSPPLVQRPHGQSSPPLPHASFGSIGSPLRPQASMDPQSSNKTTQPMAKSSSAFVDISRLSTGGSQPDESQQAKSEGVGKKSSSGGFFSGLFHKQSKEPKETKPPFPQISQPIQSSVQSGYQPFRAGQMSHPGQQLGPHPMLAGQPLTQRGQSPSPIFFNDPTQPLPSLQTAQAISMHRAAEILVSPHSPSGSTRPSSQRSNVPSQLSQSKLNKHASIVQLRQRSGPTQHTDESSRAPSRASVQSSDTSSEEKATSGNLAQASRIPPRRKPVASGNEKKESPSMTSALSSSKANSSRSLISHSPNLSDQRAPSQLSEYQESPQLGVSKGLQDVIQSSPAPSRNPSQSNRSSAQGNDTGNSSDPRETEQGQGLGVFVDGPSGAKNTAALHISLASVSSVVRSQSPNTPSSPAPSTDQGKLSKFFGAYDGGKPAPQPNKEKSAASKFFGAFKRGSKPSETSVSEPRPQASPQIAQQGTKKSGASNLTAQEELDRIVNGSSGQLPLQVQVGQSQTAKPKVPEQQIQQATAQVGQVGQRQSPPSVGPGGRGPISSAPITPSSAAATSTPPMQNTSAAKKASGEPQYDEVPIPAGYQAVHGYGAGGMLDPSPYHGGRLAVQPVQPVQYPQSPPVVQPGYPWARGMAIQQVGVPPGAVMPWQGAAPNNIPYQTPPPKTQFPVQPPNPAANVQSFPPIQQPQPVHHLVPLQQIQPVTSSQPLQGNGQGTNQPAQNGQLQPQTYIPGSTQAANSATSTPTPAKTKTPPTQLNVQPVPAVGNPVSNGGQSHPSQSVVASVPAQAQANPTPLASQGGNSVHIQSVKENPAPGLLRSPDVARLTSRMSVSRHSSNRTAGVNGHSKQTDDPYGRSSQTTTENRPVENGKYAGPTSTTTTSNTSTPASGASSSTTLNTPNTSAGSGAGAGVGAAGDNVSFLDGSESSSDSDSDENIEPKEKEEKQVAGSVTPPPAEPEEKILVDVPVELAAVHDDDDDDGMPMMTATSYPGQEWNPYGAGEFGDWD